MAMKERAAESPTDPSSRKPSAKRKRTKRPPLWWRITFEEHMVALVRLLGHEGLSVKDVPEKAKPLLEKFGRERMQEAADEITEYVGGGDAAIVRLTELARKLAVHLIGAPRPLVTAPTGDTAPSRPESAPRSDHSEAGASAPTEGYDRPEPTASEASDPAAAVPAEALRRDWVNFETQCIYQLLTRDRDFIDECRHLASVCPGQASSCEADESAVREASRHEASMLGEELERFVRNFNPLADDTTAFGELLDAALGNVDWYALAEFLLESAPQDSNQR